MTTSRRHVLRTWFSRPHSQDYERQTATAAPYLHVLPTCGKPPAINLQYYKPTNRTGRPFMPIEFAVAAYRFGHSIIRPFYVINQTTLDAGGVPIFEPDGPLNIGFNLNGGRPIPSDLVIEWKNILDVDGTPDLLGTDGVTVMWVAQAAAGQRARARRSRL
jgi:hypothetical protein